MANNPTVSFKDNNIYLGAYLLGPVQGTITVQNKQRSGGSTQVVYMGKPQDIYDYYLDYYYGGYEVQLVTGQNTGVWTLTATLNRDVITNPNIADPPNDTWQLHPTITTHNILECTDRPIIASLTTAGKEAIESQIKNPLNMATANYQGSDKTNVVAVYNLMRCGVEGKPNQFQSLMCTVTVASDYSLSWALTDCGKVLQKTTVVSNYQVPLAYSSLMPASTTITTDANGVQTFGGYYQSYPSIVNVGNNKVQVSMEWQYNSRWSAIMYDQV